MVDSLRNVLRFKVGSFPSAKESRPVDAELFVWVYLGTGQNGEVFAWLEKSYAQHQNRASNQFSCSQRLAEPTGKSSFVLERVGKEISFPGPISRHPENSPSLSPSFAHRCCAQV